MDNECRNKLNKVFLHKLHLKCIKMSNIAIINDNNNFAPSIFRSLCEFVGDCFGPLYFSSGATLPQKNTSVQNNLLRFHTTSKKMVRSYYCLIITWTRLSLTGFGPAENVRFWLGSMPWVISLGILVGVWGGGGGGDELVKKALSIRPICVEPSRGS